MRSFLPLSPIACRRSSGADDGQTLGQVDGRWQGWHWRACAAQHLLAASTLSAEQIATEVGFVSAATLRDRFRRVVGVTPTAYRHAFGGRVEAAKAAGCIQHEAARS
ncbi:helix-turn-helix domain-containing protein [Vineibacter terrae]|uniref:Helix-turn-helix domain-containing protein n=1 Tax=Vineibacter terrae TaxID=2586908 RepID=A0A5C8PDE0_9HYPH|nr:helix-turn-helix domain-containing protein [Vineibacter terrae]TXL71405.1 helix-turn-helix domain-containing protein [Vineibacter terrae]